MNVILQHNFKTGLGDFISDISQIMSTCNDLKNQGYKTHLKISLHDNKYINHPFFLEIFDDETINFFDTIEEIPRSLGLFDGFEYHSSSHLPMTPGVHHWDIFFDVKPENYYTNLYCATEILRANQIPKFIPKFNEKIHNLIDKFLNKVGEDYSFLHIRTMDEGSSIEKLETIISNVKSVVNNSKVKIHLGTNHPYLYNKLKDCEKIVTFDFDYYDIIDNDMNSFRFCGETFSKKEENPILLERLCSIFAEMVSIENSKQIIILNDYGWTSNYLFYSLAVNSGKQEIVNFYNLLNNN